MSPRWNLAWPARWSRRHEGDASSTSAVFQGASQWVLAQVSRANNRPVLLHHAIVNHAGRAVAEVLTELTAEVELDQTKLVHVLSTPQYRLQLMELPTVPAEEMRLALGWRLGELFADANDVVVPDAGNFSFDFLPLPSPQAGAPSTHGLVFGIANAALQPLQLAYHQHQMRMRVVDVPETAQRHLSALAEQDARGLAVLSFHEHGGLLTVTQGGELYLSRHLETSMEQLLRADEYTRGTLLERVALEVQRSLDVFDRQYQALGLSRLLLAPMPEMPGILATLTQNLFLPVEWFDLQGLVDMPAGLPVWQLWTAIGGALRTDASLKGGDGSAN